MVKKFYNACICRLREGFKAICLHAFIKFVAIRLALMLKLLSHLRFGLNNNKKINKEENTHTHERKCGRAKRNHKIMLHLSFTLSSFSFEVKSILLLLLLWLRCVYTQQWVRAEKKVKIFCAKGDAFAATTTTLFPFRAAV